MKFFLALVLLGMSAFVQAETTVRYHPDNSGIAVIVHGMDSDAKNLYEAMNVEAEDGLNATTKTILLTRMREPILNLMCIKSKVTDTTSCTLTFIPGLLTVISPEQGYAKFEVMDSYAGQRVANLFVKSNQAIVFESENGKLKLWKTFSPYGQVAGFTVEYSE